MANVVYPLYEKAAKESAANTDLDEAEGTTGVYVALIDTGVYTYSASHQFYSDLSGIVGTPQEILNKTVSSTGVFDGDDVSFPSVSGATVEALVFYRKNAGANTTWRLVFYMDTGVTNLPITPNGNNIDLVFNASGIFK